MKRKYKLLAVALGLCLFVTLCVRLGGASKSAHLKNENCTLQESGVFSEGVAWVTFNSDDDTNGYTQYIGAMDKTGTVQFCIESSWNNYDPFHNGLSYVNLARLLVDSDGNVVHDFTDALEGRDLTSYGNGYVIVGEEENDPLTETTTTYIVIDAKGRETEVDYQFYREYYVEDGIFWLDSDYDCDYYVAEIGKACGASTLAAVGLDLTDMYVHRSGGYVVAVDSSVESAENIGQDTPYIYYVELETGDIGVFNVGDFNLPDNTEFRGGVLEDGLVSVEYFLNDSEGKYVDVDLTTGRILDYQGQYAELFDGKIARAGDGYALLLSGNDGLSYVLFVDEDMNETAEPICIGDITYADCEDFVIDGDYLIAETGIWNLKGQQVSDGSFVDKISLFIEDNTGGSLGPINDGVFFVDENVYLHESGLYKSSRIGDYYTYDGELLFEEIDYSHAKLIA